MTIHPASINDLPALAMLGAMLWPTHTMQELKEEFAQTLQQEDAQFFLAIDDGTPVGFAQCQLRHDYVEGTDSSPVGYLEGIFVLPAYSRQGVARKLLAACEDWVHKRGCREFASDCELTNEDSLRFHLDIGFEEANRIICFTKKLREKER